jgi:RNA polymerase sigma-70 factor (ECF subfamily)
MSKKVDIALLLPLLKKRDNKGFSIFYDQYHEALYGILCKIVRDEKEAENLLQDTFVKVWKRIDDYDLSKGTFFTWILNITRNTGIDFLRSKNFSQHSKNQNLSDYVSIEIQGTNSIYLEHIGLRDIVDKLEPQYKQVVELLYYQGYTHDEASEFLKLPLGTIKSRSRIAIRELRKWF